MNVTHLKFEAFELYLGISICRYIILPLFFILEVNIVFNTFVEKLHLEITQVKHNSKLYCCCCNWSCVRCPPVSNTSPSSWSSTWKLIQLAVPASTRQWITSFLNDRRQQVRLGSITSSTQTTLSLILFCLSSFWSCPLILLNTTVNSALLTIALPSAY